MKKILSLILAALLLLSILPEAEAYEAGQAYQKDLSNWIRNDTRREYVEMMLDYHLRTNTMVQQALEGGFAAVFLFDGCSDNLDDPALADLSYYRVSGVCVVLKLDEDGQVRMLYFNDNCSTIPDRPLEYGAWWLTDVGSVGPATVCDGTYQMYSVRHKGKYEALHVRTEYYDEKLDAVYMAPGGYVSARASEINIHTRTSNHTSGRGMWSAGCPLVGGGAAWEFWKLMYTTYYTTYDEFELGNFVGCVTIDRMCLRQELYTLYGNPDAVDVFLTNSREIQPSAYLNQCQDSQKLEKSKRMTATLNTKLMSLPCSNQTDARSRVLKEFSPGETVEVLGSIRNSAGNLWYWVEYHGQQGYLFSGHMKEVHWLEKLLGSFWGNSST